MKTKNIDLSWWDSIQKVATISLECAILKAWDICKWSGYGRMGILSTKNECTLSETIHVYTLEASGSSEQTMDLKEECKIRNDDPNERIDDVTIHVNMLCYSSTNVSSSTNTLTLVCLNSPNQNEIWKIYTRHTTSLMYISITSSGFLGIYDNGDVVVSSLEELLMQMINSNNKQITQYQSTTKEQNWAVNQPIFKSDDTLCNKANIIVRSICLDNYSSFAVLTNGHGDTVKLYCSPSVIDLCTIQSNTHIEQRIAKNADSDNDEETSLC